MRRNGIYLFISLLLASCSSTIPLLKSDYSVLHNMVFIKGGSFIMGSNSPDQPFVQIDAEARRVTVSSFYICKFEVTNREYGVFLQSLPPEIANSMKPDSLVAQKAGSNNRNYFLDPSFANYPVVGVTWKQANAYSNWLSKVKKAIFRLPTEAEWEYAARGGLDKNLYPWGSKLRCPDGKLLANFKQAPGMYDEDNSVEVLHVGSYPANYYGLFDMAGNVAEWCKDHYHALAYELTDDLDPVYDEGESSPNNLKVVRGGDWRHFHYYLQCGRRNWFNQNASSAWLGFRVVKEIVKPS